MGMAAMQKRRNDLAMPPREVKVNPVAFLKAGMTDLS